MSQPEPASAAAYTLDLELEVEDGQPDAWDAVRTEALVRSILQRELQPGRYALGLHLVGESSIHELNREHRGKDAPTDVLSFGLHDPNGMRFVLPPNQPIHLGDVVISYPRVLAQAEEYGHTPERELAYLTAHGVLHILGYDHEEEADQRAMRSREEEALGALGLSR